MKLFGCRILFSRVKGYWKVLILHMLSSEPKKAYGVLKSLEELVGTNISPSTIYYLLNRMAEEGLVKVNETPNGRIYEITEKGREYLSSHEKDLEEVLEKLEVFAELNRIGVGKLLSTIVELKNALPYLNDEEKEEVAESIADFIARISSITVRALIRAYEPREERI